MSLLPLVFVSFCLLTGAHSYLTIQNGYFYDTAKQEPFVAHGFAYQTFNPPVFADQSMDQLSYDMNEMKAMHANSLRVEFTWGQVQQDEDTFVWDKVDYLVSKAEELDLFLHVLIGYQYPPYWVSQKYPEVMAVHYDKETKKYGSSQILNYNNPKAQELYADYVAACCKRYQNSTSIATWILGNEFAYFDLWEPRGIKRFVGFDQEYSLPSYHGYLATKYNQSIQLLNENWNTHYDSFDDVYMAKVYPLGDKLSVRQSGYYDLLQWRKQSVGNFIAQGAKAARENDANHLLSYASVGGVYNGYDVNIASEEAIPIVHACKEAGYPLDLWTTNVYPWIITGSETHSIEFGIKKFSDMAKIPVLVSETGYSSTDDLFQEIAGRYAAALPSALWETLMSGALGFHIFHWSDREGFRWTGFPREVGFGIIHQNRTIKKPVYNNILKTFSKMEELKIAKPLSQTKERKSDVMIYWPEEVDMGWNRVNSELFMIWAAFKRSGYQSHLISNEDFSQEKWRESSSLYLPRNYKMKKEELDILQTKVLDSGIHIFASGDLPGQFNEYHHDNANFVSRMDSIFGINVTSAATVWETGSIPIGPWPSDYTSIFCHGTSSKTFSYGTWKIWGNITANEGTTIYSQTSQADGSSQIPGLHYKDHGKAKAAIATHAIGDTVLFWGDAIQLWQLRSYIVDSIFGEVFGIEPAVKLNGTNAEFVLTTVREFSADNSTLISLFNIHRETATVTITSSFLSTNSKAEEITQGKMYSIEDDSITLDIKGDEMLIFYVYSFDHDSDSSILNQNEDKLWIVESPNKVYPNGSEYSVTVSYHTHSELYIQATFRSSQSHHTYGASSSTFISGIGTSTLHIPVDDADINNDYYTSTLEGGKYEFHVYLMDHGGAMVAEVTIPVILRWGIKPTSLPKELLPLTYYDVTVKWEDLPAYLPSEIPTPLNRGALWGSDQKQKYAILVKLLNEENEMVAMVSTSTTTASGNTSLSIFTPEKVEGLKWHLSVQKEDGSFVAGYYTSENDVQDSTYHY